MGDGHHGAFVFVQELLEPGHRFGIEVIGGLIEQQQVGTRQQEPAQGDAATLAARQPGHVGIPRRAAQGVERDLDGALQLPAVGGVDLLLQLALLGDQGVHLVVGELLGEARRDLLEPVEQPLHPGDPLEHVAHDVLGGIELGLLGQVADACTIGDLGLAAVFGVDAGHDAQQRRLARAVDAEHADLGARQEGQRDVAHAFAMPGIDLGQPAHDVDVLVGGHQPVPRIFRKAGRKVTKWCAASRPPRGPLPSAGNPLAGAPTRKRPGPRDPGPVMTNGRLLRRRAASGRRERSVRPGRR